MKSLHILLALVVFCMGQNLKAQISFGGTPISFGSKFRDLPALKTSVNAAFVPALDMQKIYAEDRQKPTNRFAVATSVNITPQNAGTWTEIGESDRIWRVLLQAQSPEVLGMCLRIDKFFIPEGGKLFVYSADKQTILGAFTEENNHESGVFATGLIESTEVWIEYYEPAAVAGKFVFSLNRIDQAYKNTAFTKPSMDKKANGFGSSGSCNLNINCTPLANDWQDEKRGVVRIIVVDPDGSGWCTGSLINNTAQNNKALFLTANHCGENSTTSHLNQWTFHFNFDITNCSSTNTSPSTSQSMVGATLRASYSNSDFFLIELNQTVPVSYNAYFNGWNKTGTNPPSSVGIHHPAGDAKKFSLDTNPTTTTNYSSSSTNSNGTHFRVVWNNGVTEGGSSGSPLFDNNGFIIGQLHGGGSSCSAPSSADWYGRVSVSWNGGGTSDSRLSSWLDPTNSGVTTLAGKNNGNAVTASFTMSPNTRLHYQPDNKTFTNTSTGATSWSWNFGTGASTPTATSAGPHNISWNTTGVRTISLSINGGASTASQALGILPTFTNEYTLADGGNQESANVQAIAETVNETGTSFEVGNSTVAGKSGVASGTKAWVTGLTATNYVSQSHSILYTPNFNCTSTGAYRFEFKTKFDTEAEYDGFIVEYSTNKGTSWSQLGTNTGANWYNSTVAGNVGTGGFTSGTPFFSGSMTTYQPMSFDVSSLITSAGQNITFRFVFKSDNTVTKAGVAIDDIQFITGLTITGYSPAPNATGVLPATNLQLTFNRPIFKGTSGSVLIARVSNNQTVAILPIATSLSITVSGNVATINPTLDLPENTALYVLIDGGVFRDANGINSPAILSTAIWRFTTTDVTLPTATAFTPINNATGVSIINNLSVTFSENIQKGTTGNINIRKISDNAVFESFNISSSKVTIFNNTLTINPTNNFSGFTTYYVEIENGYVRDLGGNNFAGFLGSGTWRFQTNPETIPPSVVSFSPTNNTQNVLPSANLVITFDEEVKKGVGNIFIKRLNNGTIEQTIAITDASVTVNNNVVTINPMVDLTDEMEFFVEIGAGVIQDISNNNYVGITSSSVWGFKTSLATSLEANTLSQQVVLYPNPTERFATIQVGKGLILQDAKITVADGAGKVVWRTEIPQLTESQTFDWKALPAGKYFLKIQSKQGTILKTFIKR